MGSTTLTDLIAEVRLAIDDRNDAIVTNARITRYINWTYLWLTQPDVFRWPELELTKDLTLVADQVVYGLRPADPGMGGDQILTVYDVVHVRAATSTDFTVTRYPLRSREQRRTDRISTFPQAETFSWYSIWNETADPTTGGGLWLDARPTGAAVGQVLQLRGYFQPALLSGAATTVLRDPTDEVIIKGAEWKMWSAIGVHDLAELAKQEFAAMVNDVTNTDRVNAEDPGRHVDMLMTERADSMELA